MSALPTTVTRAGVAFTATAAVTGRYATTGGYPIPISGQAGFISIQSDRDGVDWSQVQVTGYAFNHGDTLTLDQNLSLLLTPSPTDLRRAFIFSPTHAYSDLAIRLRFADQSERWLLAKKPSCICNHIVLGFPGNLNGIFTTRVEPVLSATADDWSGMVPALTTMLYKQDGVTSRHDVSDGLFTYGEQDQILARRGYSLLDAKKFVNAHGYEALGYDITSNSHLAEILASADVGALALYSLEGVSHFVWLTGIDGNYLYLASSFFGNVAVPISMVPPKLVVLQISRPTLN